MGVEELLERSSTASRRPRGDPERAAASDGLRFALRRIPRRDHLRAADERHGHKGQKIRFLKTGTSTKCSSWASSSRSAGPATQLQAGQVGYLICNIKSLSQVHIGDTVSTAGDRRRRAAARLPRAEADGLLRPVSIRRPGLRRAARSARPSCSINDPSFEFEPETSDALGFGFRCGFLGLLHMEIVQQRLEQRGRPRPGADRAQRDL